MRTVNRQIIENRIAGTSKPLGEPVGRDTSRAAIKSEEGLMEAHLALDGALEKKALEPVILDVRGLCSYTNYIVLVSGRSDRQVEAISDGVLASMKDRGIHSLGVEGKGSGHWILLDFGDFIMHVFHHPAREYYDLEGLWIDAARMPFDVPEEARIVAETAS